MRERLDSERAVLGTCMIHDSAPREAQSCLDLDMFSSMSHQHIFKAIRAILNVNGTVDAMAVLSSLKADGRDGEAGGYNYLRELLACGQPMGHLSSHISAVRKAYYERMMIYQSMRITQDPEDEAALDALQRFAVSRQAEGSRRYFEFDKHLPEFLESLQKPDKTAAALNTGFDKLDNLLQGLRRGDLFTVSGRPGNGKTAIMSKTALNMAETGLRVLYFSTETTAHQFVSRVLPAKSGVSAWRLRRNELEMDHLANIGDVCAAWHGNLKIAVADVPSPSLSDIVSAVTRLNPDVLIVDYLQRCKKPNGENHTRSVDNFMTALKSLCLESNVVGILGAQMSRQTDYSTGRPSLADLRDSGSIESESDQVLLLHVDKSANDPASPLLRIEGGLAKNRHGPKGEVSFDLKKEYVEITEAQHGQTVESAGN